MPTRCFVTFPATGVKAGMDNILHSVAKFIVGKFPQRTIRAINVDTKDKMKDFYNNALAGYAGVVFSLMSTTKAFILLSFANFI